MLLLEEQTIRINEISEIWGHFKSNTTILRAYSVLNKFPQKDSQRAHFIEHLLSEHLFAPK